MADYFTRKKNEIGVNLNEVQKQAVLHGDGPLLLLASPGSGKTTTIMMRIGHLIEERGVDPVRIKGVTFSKAAADDMKQRYKRMFPALPEVDFSTIHSLAFAVVRDYLRKENKAWQLIEGPVEDPADYTANKKLLLRTLFQRFNKEAMTDDQLEDMSNYISLIKNKLLPRKKWSIVTCEVTNAEQIAAEYEAVKRKDPEKLLLDYDDMLTLALEAFESDRKLLKKYQQRYDHLLTDESQDTSLVQHAIVEKLVEPHQNLCVVADDDQSIYTWRAAEPQYLLDFKKVYPKANILMMEQNYRSTPEIVNAANEFIKRNKNRYEKNMFTENDEGEPVSIKVFPDYEDQAAYLAQELSKLEDYRDAAVLYRTNSSSILIMNELERARIPFYMKDSDVRFFSHWIVEDILNFMRLTFNNTRTDLFEKISMKCLGYVTRQQLFELKKQPEEGSVFDRLLALTSLKDYQRKQINGLKRAFERMEGGEPYRVIRLIREQAGYDRALEKMSENLGFSIEYLHDVLSTLEQIAQKETGMVAFANRLKQLESLLKTSKFNKHENAVTLSTLHSSKGLEFKKVYMLDLIADVIPSKSDVKEQDKGNKDPMEEAARLFYVGMTRAEQELELLSYRNRAGSKTNPSPFLLRVNKIINPPEAQQVDESRMPQNPNAIRRVSDLEVGRKVKHRVFGTGRIEGFSEDGLEIKFPKGTKRLALDLCLTMGLLEPVE
ncbi:ATP-dependent helicase [Jeotgalibacillus haloalkalitolerans]|uniref:DNA 3'-5' helicase n=1 Tax=Jeotgalibacillus haloalkalitolerans TaxID=3104292 RepID=A0ABU5KQX1_9BACL|nr:ATP-dependent helicase [Jeotgalibacillus sp. HH7-29]MDZ5713351.1 ATP-dependent helicase [Jeotgalibacillus sp. HH7-29]